MAMRSFNPTTPSRRFMSVTTFDDVTSKKPFKPLTIGKKRTGGRNNVGWVAIRHRGGGHKKAYRVIDFRRDKKDVPGKVASVEYDPNRSARIALVHYADGDKRYILAPLGLKKGDPVASGGGSEIRPGSCLAISGIPLGTTIHNIEVQLGRGGQLVRSAGAAAQLLAKEGAYAQVRMPSGEVRLIDVRCRASIGQVSNPDHENQVIGKAGKSRWR